MITSKLVALETKIAEALPPLRVKKTLMLLPPIGHVLRGIWFDRSAYDEVSFSVTAFLMPLCVPTDHLYFNFGDRVRHKGGGDRWSMDMPNLVADLVAALRSQALPFLSRGETLEGFIEVAKSGPPTGRTLESLGYAVAQTGDAKQAIEVLSRICPMLNTNIAWQRELGDQVRALSAELAKHPEKVQKQLAQWEEETVRNLDLQEFR
jgi:hypothetical protein